MFIDPLGNSLIALFIFLIGMTIAGGVIGGKIAYDNGARVWDLAKAIILGSAFGLAAGGALVAGFAVVAGAIGFTTVLGVGVAQIFAIGALAFDFTAFITAPLFGIDMPGIEFERPKDYPTYKPPEYNYPTRPTFNSISYKNLKDIRRRKNDRISWRFIK